MFNELMALCHQQFLQIMGLMPVSHCYSLSVILGLLVVLYLRCIRFDFFSNFLFLRIVMAYEYFTLSFKICELYIIL